jgi:hypothetical protein
LNKLIADVATPLAIAMAATFDAWKESKGFLGGAKAATKANRTRTRKFAKPGRQKCEQYSSARTRSGQSCRYGTVGLRAYTLPGANVGRRTCDRKLPEESAGAICDLIVELQGAWRKSGDRGNEQKLDNQRSLLEFVLPNLRARDAALQRASARKRRIAGARFQRGSSTQLTILPPRCMSFALGFRERPMRSAYSSIGSGRPTK